MMGALLRIQREIVRLLNQNVALQATYVNGDLLELGEFTSRLGPWRIEFSKDAQAYLLVNKKTGTPVK